MKSYMKSNVNETCEKCPISPRAGANSGEEIYSLSGVKTDTPAATPTRISKKQLQETMERLGAVDWKILETMRKCNVILGKQIGRLYFADRGPRAAAVATSRKLQSLVKFGLIASTNQQLRTPHRGRLANIYYLTEAGERALQIRHGEPENRRRVQEPSQATLTHSLSVSECAVRTVETCSADDMELKSIAFEPDCWHSYRHHDKPYILKPDLAAVTKKRNSGSPNEPIELWWLIEIDLSTENVQTILDKCRRYYDFYFSDDSYKYPNGVFPMVVWVVKSEERKQLLIQRIREAFRGQDSIFVVIRDEEYSRLLRDELDMRDCVCPL